MFKGKCILTLSAFLIIVSTILLVNSTEFYENSLEATSININEMALANVAIKNGRVKKNGNIIEVSNSKNESNNNDDVVVANMSNANKRIWYLPTEYGRITQYPSYYHVAYDITSPRGSSEVIYPVASGIISGIYTDSAGAKIVTVRHIIDGKYYSSQYVHLSNYANISVGQEVTPYTPLGWMGTTGRSTGIHLHLTVLDCNMFGNTDMCSGLNSFFQYARIRYNQGFYGLSSLMDMPATWSSR